MKEYTEKDFLRLKLKKGELIKVVAISKGKDLEDTVYEVYDNEEWESEMDAMFSDFYLVDRSVLNYLLLRMRGLRRKSKIRISFYLYGKDEEDGELHEESYKLSLTGTYSNGLYKLQLHDGYFESLDIDEIY